MKAAISEVFETMFFTPVEFVGEATTALRCRCRSFIQLHDDQVWQADFYFIDPCARMITSNFLGKPEEEVSEEEIVDTLKEVANMVAGSFIFHGGTANHKIGLPGFAWIDEQARPDPQEGVTFFMDGDPQGWVALRPLGTGESRSVR